LEPVIVLREVQKKYGTVTALKKLSLDIGEGEKVLLTGPNGAGKTTLLRLISVQLTPSSGSISIYGLDSQKKGIDVKKIIGFVGHRSFLYDELTVEENLRFYGGFYEANDVELTEVVKVSNVEKKMKTRVGYLSFGYKRRVDIARALLAKPRILTLDEPFSGLDADSSNRVLSSLKQFKGTIVVSSHALEWAEELCNREIVLRDGEIQEDKNYR
jgi:ABC-type multidrug transport system ATPase subunit